MSNIEDELFDRLRRTDFTTMCFEIRALQEVPDIKQQGLYSDEFLKLLKKHGYTWESWKELCLKKLKEGFHPCQQNVR